MIIRRAVPEDAEALIAYMQAMSQEPDNNIGMAPGEFERTLDEEREILAGYAAADNAIMLVAEEDGLIVGLTNIRAGKRQAMRHAGDLGITVRQGYRGRGIGDALMSAVLAWARGTGILTRIELQVFARNAVAIHLYEKHGFRLEGRRQRAIFQNGQYQDDLFMALLL
jgi:RimJ/RimL family protein N-acetyltransferase